MNYKELDPRIDEFHIPHAILLCLSCSLQGTELAEIFPEGENQTYTDEQKNNLNKKAETHGRKHTNPRIVLIPYQNR